MFCVCIESIGLHLKPYPNMATQDKFECTGCKHSTACACTEIFIQERSGKATPIQARELMLALVLHPVDWQKGQHCVIQAIVTNTPGGDVKL